MSGAASVEFPAEIPVVLTATIAPNMAGPAAADPEMRLLEYRRVLHFCQQFAPVYFLENSTYPLDRHPDFADSPRLRIRRFAPSKTPEFGKGFQEFEMLDAWLAGEPEPPARWLKITGRYQLLNLATILDDCRHDRERPLLIDRLYWERWARTYLFCAHTAFYQARLQGCYRECDDRAGEQHFIERVLYRRLAPLPPADVQLFRTQPRVQAVAGTTGATYPTGRLQWMVKQGLRQLNRLVDRRHLLYSKAM
jgi:hypothetical protein